MKFGTCFAIENSKVYWRFEGYEYRMKRYRCYFKSNNKLVANTPMYLPRHIYDCGYYDYLPFLPQFNLK